MSVLPFPAASDSASRVTPGMYPGLSRAEYESIPAINVSILQHFEKSPKHAREAMIHPPAPTEALEFGTAFHCAVLEPRRFADEYVAAIKVDRRTNDGKRAWAEFEAANKGKSYLDAADYERVMRMRDSVWSHPVAKQLLGGLGHNEVGIVFRNDETGVLCKGLMDRVSTYDGWTWVLDAKSTLDASRREFARQCKKHFYVAKAAFYLDGCNVVAPRDRRFAWLAVEKTPPFDVAIYEPDVEALAAGRSRYMRWLRLYADAVRMNVWPGYETSVQGYGKDDVEWLMI